MKIDINLPQTIDQYDNRKFLSINNLACYEGTPQEKREMWGDGPWVNEPDYEKFSYKDYEGFILRNPSMGFLRGYLILQKNLTEEEQDNIDIHGGITYYEKKEEGTYIIGFDCGHYLDYMPAREYIERRLCEYLPQSKEVAEKSLELYKEIKNPDSYRDIEYVKSQLRSLVDQIKSLSLK